MYEMVNGQVIVFMFMVKKMWDDAKQNHFHYLFVI